MHLDVQKAMETGLFSAPDTVYSKTVGDTQFIQFDSHIPNHLVVKIEDFLCTFLRRREDKSVKKYTLLVTKQRGGRLQFLWKSNVKPQSAEIFVQKLSEFRS